MSNVLPTGLRNLLLQYVRCAVSLRPFLELLAVKSGSKQSFLAEFALKTKNYGLYHTNRAFQRSA